MGDEIEFIRVEVIQNGLLQMDFRNNTTNTPIRAFVDPGDFFKMLGQSMDENLIEYGLLQDKEPNE